MGGFLQERALRSVWEDLLMWHKEISLTFVSVLRLRWSMQA